MRFGGFYSLHSSHHDRRPARRFPQPTRPQNPSVRHERGQEGAARQVCAVRECCGSGSRQVSPNSPFLLRRVASRSFRFAFSADTPARSLNQHHLHPMERNPRWYHRLPTQRRCPTRRSRRSGEGGLGEEFRCWSESGGTECCVQGFHQHVSFLYFAFPCFFFLSTLGCGEGGREGEMRRRWLTSFSFVSHSQQPNPHPPSFAHDCPGS